MVYRLLKLERRSFLVNILLAYNNFSGSFRLMNKKTIGERDLLLLVLTGTIIFFMANLPMQIIKSYTIVDVDTKVYIGLIGFISFFFIPLFMYFIAGIIFVVCKIFKGTASFFESRLALFWSINVAGPLIIFEGCLLGFFSEVKGIEYASIVLQIFIAWIISTMVAEAEQFRSKLPTFFAAVVLVLIPHFMPLQSS